MSILNWVWGKPASDTGWKREEEMKLCPKCSLCLIEPNEVLCGYCKGTADAIHRAVFFEKEAMEWGHQNAALVAKLELMTAERDKYKAKVEQLEADLEAESKSDALHYAREFEAAMVIGHEDDRNRFVDIRHTQTSGPLDLAEFYKNISIGSVVFDDLTHEIHRVIDIKYDEFGNQGIWLDSDEWLGGGRYPWEVSPPHEVNIAKVIDEVSQ